MHFSGWLLFCFDAIDGGLTILMQPSKQIQELFMINCEYSQWN